MSTSQALTFTAHARSRCAQRAIPPFVVDLIVDYGATARLNGADSYSLTKEGRRQLRRELGEVLFRAIERSLDAYAVIADDGVVITAAWRTRRLRRR